MSDKIIFIRLPAKGDPIRSHRYCCCQWKSVGRKFLSSSFLSFCMLVLLIALLLIDFFQPIFSGYTVINSIKIDDFNLRYNYPNFKNWFRTDTLNKSLFDAVWAGAKTSISIAMLGYSSQLVSVSSVEFVGACQIR